MAFLEMTNISKYFGQLAANQNVNLSVEKGEIHALLGENGAGKSTLMNILYGVYGPSEGEIRMNGELLSIQNPRDALAKGIGMVHQHFMLIPALMVIENVVLGLKEYEGVLDLNKAAAAFEQLAKRFGMSIDPWAKVESLTVGQQQRVEILKALFREVDLLILDEPTAVLTPQEVRDLFNTIKMLTNEGLTIIFISHKLMEIMELCARCTILRAGKVVQTVRICEVEDRNRLAAMMVGKDLLTSARKNSAFPGKDVLTIENLCCESRRGVEALKNVSLNVRAGEILGICGVDGNGQSELVRCITGLQKPSGGCVRINGAETTRAKPRDILRCGVSHIPEDRHKMGIVATMSVNDNLILMDYNAMAFCNKGFLNGRRIRARNQELCAAYEVKAGSLDDSMRTLSGGNQQKCVVGRELARKPKLLIAMHPSRGLDVGATKYIQNEIVRARDEKTAVLLVSTELEEILELSDRILVLFEGRVVGVVNSADVTMEMLGLMMVGISPERPEAHCAG